MKLKTFVVEGCSPFPYDMLRYVPCWPAQQSDAEELNPRFKGEALRSVTMETFTGSEITPERWKSFGWTVRP